VGNTLWADDPHLAGAVIRDGSFSLLLGYGGLVLAFFVGSVCGVSVTFSPVIPIALAERVGESGLGRLFRRFVPSHHASRQPA